MAAHLCRCAVLLAPDITDFFYRANTANQLKTVQDAAALASAGDATADGAGDVAPSEQEDADDPAIQLAQAGSSALPWLKDYNERVRSGAGPAVNDPFTFSSSDSIFAETGLSSGPVGVISVPAMDCELPLYLGSTKQNMALGAAVVAGTSAPIGETDSNCVIAGHRGYSGALFFREIENMKIGDTVTLSTIWGTFTYRAVEFKAVLPTDVAAVSVQPGKDLVTLSTCHPYPYNSHRYLAICERVTDDAVRESANESSSGLGALAGTDLIGSGGQPLLDDGSVNVLFFENVGRLVGRVLLVVLAIWAIWGGLFERFAARPRKRRILFSCWADVFPLLFPPRLLSLRRLSRHAAICILRADELRDLAGVLQCAGFTDGSTARKRESTWHVP